MCAAVWNRGSHFNNTRPNARSFFFFTLFLPILYNSNVVFFRYFGWLVILEMSWSIQTREAKKINKCTTEEDEEVVIGNRTLLLVRVLLQWHNRLQCIAHRCTFNQLIYSFNKNKLNFILHSIHPVHTRIAITHKKTHTHARQLLQHKITEALLVLRVYAVHAETENRPRE